MLHGLQTAWLMHPAQEGSATLWQILSPAVEVLAGSSSLPKVSVPS